MTTDTTALQERIARAMWAGFAADQGYTTTWEELSEYVQGTYLHAAAAVLPIIAAEVQAAKAEAWDEATRVALNFAYLNQEDRITLHLRPPHDRNPYRATETGDEHD